MKNKIKATVILFLTASIWGFAFVAQRIGAEYVGTFTFTGIRFALGALSLIPVILIFEREPKNSGKARLTVFVGIAAGVILFAATTLQQYGIFVTQSAGKAGFITSLYIVLVPIIGLLWGNKTGWPVWAGAVFAVVGLYFLCVTKNVSIGIGDVVLLIGSFLWAFHILLIDRYVAHISSLKLAAIQFTVCSVLSLIMALTTELDTITIANLQGACIPILYGGLMSVGVAYTCQIIGQRYADPTYASIIFSTEAVFSAIGGALILGEIMNGRSYFGCALIFTGILISQIKVKSHKKSIS